MFRTAITAVLGVLILVGSSSAQVPARLRWQTGQVVLYKVEQTIGVSEVVGDKKSETAIKVNHIKRWQVMSVDADGVATVQHSLVALRQETRTTDGKTLLFDSADPDKSSPELKDAMSKFVGVPLAVLRVDSLGRVLEVKESKFGPANRFESELPFVGVLPADALKPGLTWDRSYNLTLGADANAEKFAAVQRYTCKSATKDEAVVSVTTEFKNLPEAPLDRVPLLQRQPAGEIVYDLAAGRLKGATLKIDNELKNHQGEGSAIRVTGSYVETYAGDR
jgi:hypothetical protein